MKKNTFEDKPMTIQEVREYLGLSRDKAYALFRELDFPCVRFGRHKIVMKSDLHEWIKNHRYTNVDLVA